MARSIFQNAQKIIVSEKSFLEKYFIPTCFKTELSFKGTLFEIKNDQKS